MSVTTLNGADIETLLAPSGTRGQPLEGFDETYVDIVDYIIRCTHRIWEQKDVGLIRTHYSQDCPVHTLTGTISSTDAVIAGTLRTLSGFPDRTLYGEAVIWSGNESEGYLSSHRIVSHATNSGPSEFGAPTGRRVCFTTVADCLCRQNRIVEEWLVRDNSAIALQLGLAPRDIARRQAQTDRAASEEPQVWRTQQIDAIRHMPVTPFPDGAAPTPDTPHEFARWLFDAVWNHKRLKQVRDVYAPNASWSGPGGRRLFGWGEITGWIAALLSTFSGARVAIDHVGMVETSRGREIALRWRLAGRHDGPALYGPASGRDVLILAITHWLVESGRITEETTIFDEIAVLRQIEGGL